MASGRGPYRFIDLFAGLGGFHVGLSKLGFECVFACEIDPQLRDLYERNFGIRPAGDIREISVDDVPTHDVLCAGFPCQPFSKAGEQRGLECPDSGDQLFRAMIRIVRRHRPSFLLLENVANLEKHDSGRTWQRRIRRRLTDAGYRVAARTLSPHQFGIPQVRPRFFIIAARDGLDHFDWPEPMSMPADLSIRSVLDRRPPDAKRLTPEAIACLDAWQRFLDHFPKNEELPSFPIWSMEFGATYPYADGTPYSATPQLLARRCGSHGFPLGSVPIANRMDHLPSYARTRQRHFPSWKVGFIRQNREFYERHRDWIDRWLPEILQFPPSLQKLEWNCKGEARNIRQFVIQFRASGVRLKRPTTAPSLVAMTTTQVPIIGWEERYMTPRECSRLQCLEDLGSLPDANTRAYKALGNAVNSRIVSLLADRLCRTHKYVGDLILV